MEERDVQTVIGTLMRIEENTNAILELLGEDGDDEEAEEDE
jgi:hypothetical protein